MSKKQFSQEQKLKILESAGKLGARPAADIAGIHCTTVYEWRNQLKARGKTVVLCFTYGVGSTVTPRCTQLLRVGRVIP